MRQLLHESLIVPISVLILLLSVPFTGCDKMTTESTKSDPAVSKQHASDEDNHSHDEEGKAQSTADTTIADHKHDNPNDTCFICDPSKRDKGRLWCKEHSRYEDRCWLCHPELEEKNRLYCKEHGLYEDECFLCHPELLEKKALSEESKNQSSSLNLKAVGLFCKEHGVPESECGICHPDLLAQCEPGQGLKFQLPSKGSAEKAGIVTKSPEIGESEQGIECLAEFTFNKNKVAIITPLVGGTIDSVAVDLGTRVKEGDLLVRMKSSAIGETQSSYLEALVKEQLDAKTLQRKRNLHAQRLAPEKDLQEAEAAHAASSAVLDQTKHRLQMLGFSKEQIERIAERRTPQGVLEIRAPFAGEIVERTAVRGEMADEGKPLLTLADTLSLWAMVNIPESQLSSVQVGQQVQLTVDSLPNRSFTGTLTWVSPSVNDQTRMAQGRVEVRNEDYGLKAHMFAKALIMTDTNNRSLMVPETALQTVAGKPLIFVKSQNDFFEARSVQLGGKQDGRVAILNGLKPEEDVVVAGSFSLKSQFLISRLGAGCCE